MAESNRYSKPFLSFEKQVDLLEERGLIVPDKTLAIDYLRVVNYYRLSAYTLVFELPSSRNSRRSHQFKENTSFNDIVKLYEFDHKLRLHSMKAIESIEVAFRTAICYYMSEKHGSHWYEDANNFRDRAQHSSFLGMIDRELDRSSEIFVTHYRTTYSSPPRPPAWMVTELFTLGTISKLFKNIGNNRIRKDIAEHFSLRLPVLESWMHSYF